MPGIPAAPLAPAFAGRPAAWNRTAYAALLSLFFLWALKFYTTWANWGSISSDTGHELYIPAQLAQGKQLYRDIWFMYGPASAYLNSFLYRLFGIHISVLYWAGSFSVLLCAIFLFLIGRRLSSGLVGWAAGAALLLEAFHPTIFSFPLPYTYAAAYACLAGCIFLWLTVVAVDSPHWGWILAAGFAAAIALLQKPEYGVACYATLALLIAVRAYRERSLKTILPDVLATIPGIVLCAMVVYWMISLKGVDFITQENILSWPTSYFMKNFGMRWLQSNGFTIDRTAFSMAFWRGVLPLGVLLLAWSVLWWKRWDRLSILLRSGLLLGLILYVKKSILFVSPLPVPLSERLSFVFFPQDMVLYVAIASVAVWIYFFWRRGLLSAAVPLAMTYASLSAFRILMGMHPLGYSIFYNGPVILCFLFLFCLIIPRSTSHPMRTFAGEAFICFGSLLVVFLSSSQMEARADNYVSLQSNRGVMRTTVHMKRNYDAALQFMREKSAKGEVVLSVPEDVSLYFLAETECPTRFFQFTPGIVAPGKMTSEVIQEIERAHVQYLLWSNREYFDFGVSTFGEDYDQQLGDYLKSHYRRVGPLTAGTGPGWSADIWERIEPSTQAAGTH